MSDLQINCREIRKHTLNLGSARILRQALRTSIFLSLFAVLGKLEPAQDIMVPSTLSELFRRLAGAKGDGPSSWIRCSSSCLFFGHFSSLWTIGGLSRSVGGVSRGVRKLEEVPMIEGEDEEEEAPLLSGDRT